MRPSLIGRFSRFLGAGAIGFLIDSGSFAFCIEVAGLGAVSARLLAFMVAAGATWQLNRSFTFADRRLGRKRIEFGRYAVATSIAGMVNLSVYAATLYMAGTERLVPYIALVAGVGAGLAVNFILYNVVVFRSRDDLSP